MIETQYREKAAEAADALRAALIAVEECGADVELTNIVIRLADDRARLCNLFGLDPVQASQADTHGSDGRQRGQEVMKDVHETMLEDMRWQADQVITNYDGERVWLKQIEHGITDCCPESDPCSHHRMIGQEVADAG